MARATNALPESTDLIEFATALGVDAAAYRAARQAVERMKETHAAADAKVRHTVNVQNEASQCSPEQSMLRGDWRPGGPGGSVELSAEYERRAVARRAIELAEKECAAEQAKLSAAVCAKLRPEWRKTVAEIAAALRGLKTAIQAERKFTLALQDADVRTGNSWHNLPRIVDADLIDVWLAEVQADGNL